MRIFSRTAEFRIIKRTDKNRLLCGGFDRFMEIRAEQLRKIALIAAGAGIGNIPELIVKIVSGDLCTLLRAVL